MGRRLVPQLVGAGYEVVAMTRHESNAARLSLGPDGLGNAPAHVQHIMTESMEALIHHFKLVTEGFRVPPGQTYTTVESPRGTLGAHVVSDGGTRPYRVHLREPSFVNVQCRAGDRDRRPALRRHSLRRFGRRADGWLRPVTR